MWNGGSGGSNHGLSLVFGAKGQLRNNFQKIKSRFTDNNISRSRLVHELSFVFPIHGLYSGQFRDQAKPLLDPVNRVSEHFCIRGHSPAGKGDNTKVEIMFCMFICGACPYHSCYFKSKLYPDLLL